MDKAITTHTEQYFIKFKTDIQKKAIELSFNERDKLNELLEYVFEYEKITFNKEIFIKKKQQKTMGGEIVPVVFSDEERCIADRKQGDRCTRKRVKGNLYCGTHCVKYNSSTSSVVTNKINENEEKKVPANNKEKKPNQVEVIAHEIQGIIYYIDKELNVYNTEDIFKNINNPQIIAKAVQLSHNVFSIPSLGL